jgi:uncharacterized membrane protein
MRSLSPAAILREPQRHSPVVVGHARLHAADVQLRIADGITRFAGSMRFVYLHAVAFAGWMLLFESSPWPTLTLVVSLEAIFLSTFVMIGQNRQAGFQQAKADHDFLTEEQELHRNTDLTVAIHDLTRQIHQVVVAQAELSRHLPTDPAAIDPAPTDPAPTDPGRANQA